MKSEDSQSTLHTAELLLKFQCSACDQILNVGIERLRDIATNCPRCETPVQVPTLDRNVGGVEQVLRANPETLKLDCPACGKTAKIPVRSNLTKTWKCPGCGEHSKIDLVSVAAKKPVSANIKKEHSVSAPHTRNTVPPDMTNTTEAPITDVTTEIEPATESVFDHEPVPKSVVYGSTPSKHTTGFRLPAFLSSLSPRQQAWLIWFILEFPVLFFVLMPLTAYTKNPAFGVLMIGWIIPRFGLSAQLTQLIMILIMKTYQCPHCHEEYEAVGRWGCSCGYVDHKERHILAFRCPMCRSVIGHANCERCEATIFLR